jgi:hypothetical protein
MGILRIILAFPRVLFGSRAACITVTRERLNELAEILQRIDCGRTLRRPGNQVISNCSLA